MCVCVCVCFPHSVKTGLYFARVHCTLCFSYAISEGFFVPSVVYLNAHVGPRLCILNDSSRTVNWSIIKFAPLVWYL